MHRSRQLDSGSRNFAWRAGLCLFLALLFFYNPFFTIYGSPAGVSAQHPPSFRGTVASSELRRSVVKQAVPKPDAPEEAVLEVVQRPAVLRAATVRSQEEPHLSEKEATLGSLWFRPPPFSPSAV